MNNQNTPLVSVIITTFNVEKFIGNTINSVLNSTFKNYEIILVDDSSDDNTLNIIKAYAEKEIRIKYYKIEHTGIPAAPRNFGINKSSGSLIAFLDGDDVWNKDKLFYQVKYLQNNPDKILVYSMSLTIGEVNVFSPLFEVLPLLHKAAVTKEDLTAKGNSITCSSVLVKTEAIKSAGCFDEDIKLKAVEDYDLWLRLSDVGEFGFIPRIHSYYRIHKNQSSADWQTKQARLDYLSLKRNLNLRKYSYYRNKNIFIRLARNTFHALTYLYVGALSLADKSKLFMLI